MTQTRNKPIRVTEQIIDRKRAESKVILNAVVSESSVENAAGGEGSLDINTKLKPLFQKNPDTVSTYMLHKNQTFTDSLQSYQYGAYKETQILQYSGRIPTKKIIIHFQTELSVEDIIKHRKKIFQVLRKAGLQAVVAIELTNGKNGKPNNTVHFHVLTDDVRSGNKLRALLNKACEDSGLNKKDYRVDYGTVADGIWYFDYFTKFDRKRKDLFAKCDCMRQAFVAEFNRMSLKCYTMNNGKNKDFSTEYARMKEEYFRECIRQIEAFVEKEDRKIDDNDRKWNWRTVLLFEKRTLQKFYQIGKWFGKSKKRIWDEIKKLAAANG